MEFFNALLDKHTLDEPYDAVRAHLVGLDTTQIKNKLPLKKKEYSKSFGFYLRMRNVEFFSRASARISAVRSVRPVLLRLSTSRRVLASRALNSLNKLKGSCNYL